MAGNDHIIQRIKSTIQKSEPGATVILFGSYARQQQRPGSDIDVLILIDRDEITWETEKKIKFPLYNIEFETGTIISPMVVSKKDWEEKHRITPFFDNVKKEGVIL
jgi:uncharacterized protein